MKTNTQNNKGFTLIELIMVTIILGILAAVAIPRYSASLERAEAAAENAVISSIKAGLESYAMEQYIDHGRKNWPADPFEALEEPITGQTTDVNDANEDGEWTFNTSTNDVTHMRGDNTVHTWAYTQGTTTSGSEAVGSFPDLFIPNPSWCGSYCWDLNNGMTMPNPGWPPSYPVEECDCSQYDF